MSVGLPPRVRDISGTRFGRLVALRYEGPYERRVKSKWRCRCDCGQETIAEINQLKCGKTRSCGCLRAEKTGDRFRTHPNSDLRTKYIDEYGILIGMVQRCHNPGNKAFKWYGARGIAVCDRWRFGEGGKAGLECFLDDMGPRPHKKLSIDRIDNDGNYHPGNCRWATAIEQARNQRRRKVQHEIQQDPA